MYVARLFIEYVARTSGGIFLRIYILDIGTLPHQSSSVNKRILIRFLLYHQSQDHLDFLCSNVLSFILLSRTEDLAAAGLVKIVERVISLETLIDPRARWKRWRQSVGHFVSLPVDPVAARMPP